MDTTILGSWKTLSEIFNNFAIGLAAMAGILWGIIKGITEFVKMRKKNSFKDNIRKMYPRERINKIFKIIDHEKAPGKLYLLDLNKKEKYWIQSGTTLLDLGFFWDDANRISEKEFESYKEGPGILTVGTPGS